MSLMCKLGYHKEIEVVVFPYTGAGIQIYGLRCERCRRHRCVTNGGGIITEIAFIEAREWLEAVTGTKVIGPFVETR